MEFRITVEPVADAKVTISAAKSFPPGVEQITFGREPANDIVFPPEARVVGRRHGRLYRQPSGQYAIEPSGEYYIEVDGYAADRGQTVKDGARVRLGDPSGPLMRVRLEEVGAIAEDPNRTLMQKPVAPVSRRMAIQGRIIAGGVAALVILAAVVGLIYYQFTAFQRDMAALRDTVSERAEASFAGDDGAALTSTLMASTYAVIRRAADGSETLQGTAWPYAPGVLVTNAHVVRLLDMVRGTNDVILIRPPHGSGAEYGDVEVISGQQHPGYAAFQAFLDTARAESPDFNVMGADLPRNAYDVGILRVAEDAVLLPLLTVADDVVLAPGQSLALAGYPVRDTATEASAHLDPTPQLRFGEVTSTTNYFLFGDDAAHAHLIQNSIPVTGGASGSAVINAEGEVVAVLSGGTLIEDLNTPSAVLINYAQRADLIGGAVDPASFDLMAATAEWRQALARFSRHEQEMVAAAQLALQSETTNRSVVTDTEESASLDGQGSVEKGTVLYREHTLTVVAGRTYTVLVYGEPGSSLSMALFRDGKGFNFASGSRPYSTLTFTAEADGTVQVRVLGASSDPVNYNLHVFSAGPAPASAAAGST